MRDSRDGAEREKSYASTEIEKRDPRRIRYKHTRTSRYVGTRTFFCQGPLAALNRYGASSREYAPSAARRREDSSTENLYTLRRSVRTCRSARSQFCSGSRLLAADSAIAVGLGDA
ncbi:hypothetical protein CCMA1212_010524 [Trichoderma ghanense]|uniref:Uncharacterized protein n=1 Tax=Trichoderma ghanense TaxID=65468 RepID=A0ABY2GPI4_9HYPO